MTGGSSEQLNHYHDTWGTNRDGLFDKGVAKNNVNIILVPTHFFINPTEAHNYKITGMLRQLKFPQLLRHVSVHSGTIIRELFLA